MAANPQKTRWRPNLRRGTRLGKRREAAAPWLAPPTHTNQGRPWHLTHWRQRCNGAIQPEGIKSIFFNDVAANCCPRLRFDDDRYVSGLTCTWRYFSPAAPATSARIPASSCSALARTWSFSITWPIVVRRRSAESRESPAET